MTQPSADAMGQIFAPAQSAVKATATFVGFGTASAFRAGYADKRRSLPEARGLDVCSRP
ncbi:hypothetical protein CHELA40_10306 [Chelatococcus asaccharovorans]|nr:hypothetical protein CHELA40_10306 [Chelatococcus asaccharovorans]CAH1686828.1 hypothetical protein CHELA17_65302 [Chelatococcus asaccharovorans]